MRVKRGNKFKRNLAHVLNHLDKATNTILEAYQICEDNTDIADMLESAFAGCCALRAYLTKYWLLSD